MAGSKKQARKPKPPNEAQVNDVLRAIAYAVTKQDREPTLQMILSLTMQQLSGINQQLTYIASLLRDYILLTTGAMDVLKVGEPKNDKQ